MCMQTGVNAMLRSQCDYPRLSSPTRKKTLLLVNSDSAGTVIQVLMQARPQQDSVLLAASGSAPAEG